MAEFRQALEQIRTDIPASMLQKCVKGMANRMTRVIDLQGAVIGK
jgi:hypothetical protein